jgi:hypothetical protein
MNKGLLTLALLLGASTVHANTIAECRGSTVETSAAAGEIYTVSRTGNSLVVVGQYVSSEPVTLALSPSTVKEDTAQTLKVENSKKNILGLTSYEAVLTIDFSTGNGTLSVYEPLESLLKPKVVYLASCSK